VAAYFENHSKRDEDWELQAQLFFSHYDSLGWKNSTGAKIVNWDSLANKWILTQKTKLSKNGAHKQVDSKSERDAEAEFAEHIARKLGIRDTVEVRR
jgi:hypothetical protein